MTVKLLAKRILFCIWWPIFAAGCFVVFPIGVGLVGAYNVLKELARHLVADTLEWWPEQ